MKTTLPLLLLLASCTSEPFPVETRNTAASDTLVSPSGICIELGDTAMTDDNQVVAF